MWSTSCLPLLQPSLSPIKACLHSRLQQPGRYRQQQQHITEPYLPLPLCSVIATMHLLVQLIKWVFPHCLPMLSPLHTASERDRGRERERKNQEKNAKAKDGKSKKVKKKLEKSQRDALYDSMSKLKNFFDSWKKASSQQDKWSYSIFNMIK